MVEEIQIFCNRFLVLYFFRIFLTFAPFYKTMNNMTIKFKKMSLTLLAFAGLLSLALLYRQIQVVQAEQSGGSPESGASSRLTTLATALSSLSYGSTSAGSWGDWGTSWNRIYSAATAPFNDAVANTLKNGGNTDYPQSVGGVDDYNNNAPIPADSYQSEWTTCAAENDYCGTGRSVAEKKEVNTGLVWSARISSSANWFVANNCAYPNGLPGDDGVCNTNGEVACKCVKLTSSKTGCEGYDDGNWRLPTQKEIMMSYIDGSWAQLTNAGANYWSSTTTSNYTQLAWFTNLNAGATNGSNKTTNYSVRCVR